LDGLDLSHNSSLEILNCSHNKLTELDLSGNPALIKLYFSANPLHFLDVSRCALLTELIGGDDGHLESMVKLKTIDISSNEALTRLSLSSWLQGLDVSNNPLLTHIKIFRTAITSLDLSKNARLSYLKIMGGSLSYLDLCNNTSLDSLVIQNLVKLDRVLIQEMSAGEVYKEIEYCPSVRFFACSVGIETSYTTDFSIYPNPAFSLLTIHSSLPADNTIEISSLNGQVIYRAKMEGSSHQVDLSGFHNGVYFITIRSKDLVSTSKIIKL